MTWGQLLATVPALMVAVIATGAPSRLPDRRALRRERIRIAREVHRAERQLDDLTIRTIQEMFDETYRSRLR